MFSTYSLDENGKELFQLSRPQCEPFADASSSRRSRACTRSQRTAEGTEHVLEVGHPRETHPVLILPVTIVYVHQRTPY